MFDSVWSDAEWQIRDAQTRARALSAPSAARACLVRHGRAVLKKYSTSFFIVTRFLPPAKRAQVNLVYAAVRYPDEIVDSLALTAEQRARKLQHWRAEFERARQLGTLQDALLNGVPVILAGMAEVMRETGIPAEYYHAFLDAMYADVYPRRYGSLDDLIENYIYGSAIVVGYFLVHIYGATDHSRAMESARRLGIALQLTNFIRDVADDSHRGRLYLPLDLLRAHGVEGTSFESPAGRAALTEVVRAIAGTAAAEYDLARAGLDAFQPDCRLAIEACISVYSELNRRVGASAELLRRESVPISRKFSVLPASKYWRLPLAYMGLEPA